MASYQCRMVSCGWSGSNSNERRRAGKAKRASDQRLRRARRPAPLSALQSLSAGTMLTFLAKRIVQLIPTLFFVSVLIFSLQQLLPGDPAMIMAGEDRDPEVIEQIRKQYRLDQPIPVQYVYWIKGVLTGDLGESMRFKQQVLPLILQKLPVTMQLASMAIIIALAIGITAGVISAVMKDTVWDYAANVFALWGLSTPNFWLGIMMIFLFSVQLGWLPPSGYVPLTEDWR